MAKHITTKHHDESSESEAETESAKIFHRQLATNVKSSIFTVSNKVKFYLICEHM